MKYISAIVFNKLSKEERQALFSYFKLMGKFVPIFVSSYSGQLSTEWAIEVSDLIVNFNHSRKNSDFYKLSEIQNMIMLSLL